MAQTEFLQLNFVKQKEYFLDTGLVLPDTPTTENMLKVLKKTKMILPKQLPQLHHLLSLNNIDYASQMKQSDSNFKRRSSIETTLSTLAVAQKQKIDESGRRVSINIARSIDRKR